MVDDDCLEGKFFGLCWDTLGKITVKEVGINSIVEQAGSTFLRDAGYDKYTAFISCYDNKIIGNRRANWKMEDVTVSYAM